MFKRAILLTFFLGLFFSFLGTASPALAVSDTDAFVTRSGTKFMLNGKEFRFVGFNLFDAAATDRYKCAGWAKMSDDQLDSALTYMREKGGATVLRFWAFQPYTDSGKDWTGMDRVIRLAKKNGFKVIPVLENGPKHCTGDPNKQKWEYQGDTWYTNGYKSKWGSDDLNYKDYVKAVVTRYKDEPAILGWMMMNEADTSAKDSQGKSVLVNFTKDVAPFIKAIDSKHLLTVGTQSNGASGATGKDFVDVYGIPEIDFTEAHDWGWWSGNEMLPLPGSSDGKTLPDHTTGNCLEQYDKAKVACSIAYSVKVLNKPFVMGEAGIRAENNAASRQTRADGLDGKMKASFDNGVAGYLIWQWNTVVDSEKFDILQSDNDPLMAKMKARAGYQIQLGAGDTTQIPTCGRADINKDKSIDLTDYGLLVLHFFSAHADADINQSGLVDITDFGLLVKDFYKDCS